MPCPAFCSPCLGILRCSWHSRGNPTILLGEEMMRKGWMRFAVVALLGLFGTTGFVTTSRAETGQGVVVFTKGGFIVGVGGGEGVLVFRGKRYPFTVSGMSVGFTIGASTTKVGGRALNLRAPASIERHCAAE